jgi:type VI secretion system protein ImpF
MADISLRERLQPALLDRLLDDERSVHQLKLTVPRARLEGTGITVRMLVLLMQAHGLRRIDENGEAPADQPDLCLRFSAAAGDLPLARLKALTLPLAAGSSMTLGELAKLEVNTSINTAAESADRRFISMRRLREYVCRDLAWLLNTASLDTSEDLQRYPEVRRSVLNFGLPSLTGRSASSIDPEIAVRQFVQAIRVFEPRLSRVAVTPELATDRMDSRTLSFKVDAELWGRPAPQGVSLRTSLDVDSGTVSLTDSGG